jgi:hypothetical protein
MFLQSWRVDARRNVQKNGAAIMNTSITKRASDDIRDALLEM